MLLSKVFLKEKKKKTTHIQEEFSVSIEIKLA